MNAANYMPVIAAMLAAAGILIVVEMFLRKRRTGSYGTGKTAAAALLLASIVCSLISSVVGNAVGTGAGGTEGTEATEVFETVYEWTDGTVTLYNADGDVVFEYEGVYRIDVSGRVIEYSEGSVECEFRYPDGCTVEVR